MCLWWSGLSLCIEMRNYKRAKPRFEGTVLRTVWSSKLLGAEHEPRQNASAGRCGAGLKTTQQRGKGEGGKRKGFIGLD